MELCRLAVIKVVVCVSSSLLTKLRFCWDCILLTPYKTVVSRFLSFLMLDWLFKDYGRVGVAFVLLLCMTRSSSSGSGDSLALREVLLLYVGYNMCEERGTNHSPLFGSYLRWR